MTLGVVGLGLIGGSLCKAFSAYTDHSVFGCDIDPAVTGLAGLAGAVGGPLTRENLPDCEVVFLAIRPGAVVTWLQEHADALAPGAVVIDCAGTKRQVCAAAFPLARAHGFTFLGGHPMAGYHRSGFKYARETLYKGASMILVPENTENISLLDRVSRLLKSAGFGSVTVTDAATHDRTVAFTSQLAHVVSNAYVKSPQAEVHRGFSAGSYRDLTRVARLDEAMWTELFLENADNLTEELDHLISSLSDYRAALAAGDAETLRRLLREGRERKEAIDR